MHRKFAQNRHARPELDEPPTSRRSARRSLPRLANGTIEVPVSDIRFWDDACLRFFDTLQFVKKVAPRATQDPLPDAPGPETGGRN